MQLNVLFTKTCVHFHKFIVPSAVAGLAVSLSRRQNGTMMKAKKKELGDWRETEVKTEPKCSHYPVKSVVIDEHERAAASEAKNGLAILRNDHILMFGEVFETVFTFWNSFNMCFTILLTLSLHMVDRLKACAMPTNSNAHVSPVGSKVIEMCKPYTTNMYT